MGAKSLVNLDLEALMREKSINEADEVQKRLLREADRKREELRIMVGERYRDLIEAADTIREMKFLSSNCVRHISKISQACQKIGESQSLQLKNEIQKPSPEKPFSNAAVYGIAVQIKILMSVPEQIWSSIDAEDFLTATQIFLLSRHIYTGLQLETGIKTNDKTIKSLAPVVHKQWNNLSNFNHLLIDVIQKKLSDPDLNAEVATSCLSGLFLLNSKKDLIDLLNTFITIHSTNSLTVILSGSIEENVITGNKMKDDIKNKISTSLKVITKTAELIYSCFVENGGSVLKKLQSLFHSSCRPLVSLLEIKDQNTLKYLPPVVSNYKLTHPTLLQAIAKSELSLNTESWILWVKKFTSEKVESLLKYVNTAKILQHIRKDALSIELPKNWSLICNEISLEEKMSDVWMSLFQPLITDRLKNIISRKLSTITEEFTQNILKTLNKFNEPGITEKEINLNWFVWNDIIGKSSIDSKENVIEAVNSLMTEMAMQDKGFTPNLEKLCQDFDKNLGIMLEDIKVYTEVHKKDLSNEEYKTLLIEKLDSQSASKKYSDYSEIESFLCDSTKQMVKIILKFITEECVNKSTKSKDLDDIQLKAYTITMARLLQAMPQLVHNLQICFIPLQTQPLEFFDEFQVTNTSFKQTWDEQCQLIQENCYYCWSKWIETTLKTIDDMLIEMLPKDFNPRSKMEYLLVQWDSITIEEKDEQDQIVKSTIKLPSSPSIKLQQCLFNIGRILDDVVSHTLPRKIHLQFIDSVAEKMLQYYSNLIKENLNDVNQRCALQLMMDIRHITLILISRENKKLLSTSHEICDIIKQKIDPFDYDVFYPRLQINIKRSVQRVQILLGNLIPNHDHLNSTIGTKPLQSGGTADKDPNSYLLVSQGNNTANWFSLLPVTAPLTAKKQIEKQKKRSIQNPSAAVSPKPTTEQLLASSITNTTSGASSLVKSGAAFFGSMTSDWFGS